MSEAAYPVTTIGEVVSDCCGGCKGGGGCAANDTTPRTIGAIDDFTILINPLAWGAQKLFGAIMSKATGQEPAPTPTAIDQLARAMGVKPIDLAISLTGYTGLGRYETAAKVIGGGLVVGAAALYVARRMKKRKKGKRG